MRQAQRQRMVVLAALCVVLALVATSPNPARAGIVDGSGVPDPADSRMYAWYRSDAGVIEGDNTPAENGDRVLRWEDQSGAGRNLNAYSGGPLFSAAGFNGLPSVRFDGGDGRVAGSNVAWGVISQPNTIFAAARTDAADGGYIFDSWTSAGRHALYAGQSTAPNQWHVWAGGALASAPITTGELVHAVEYNGANSSHYINSAFVAGGNAGTNSMNGMGLGSRLSGTGSNLTGDIAEVLVYNGSLTPAERADVETYLLQKYNITPPAPLPTKHSADFPYRYEFEVQPNTQDEDSNGAVDFWPGWDIGAITAGVASAAYTDTNRAGSVATDFALGGNDSIWREHFLTGDWTVETGLKITTQAGSEGSSGSIAMLLATNGNNQENFFLRVGRDDMRITLPGGSLQTIDTSDNTADIVAIRVARVADKHYVWRDGVLLNASEAPADGFDWAPNTVGSTGLRTSFGIDGRYFSSTLSGSVDFDYFRLEPSGAFAPGAGVIPEPATLTLSLLGGCAVLLKLRKRRLAP